MKSIKLRLPSIRDDIPGQQDEMVGHNSIGFVGDRQRLGSVAIFPVVPCLAKCECLVEMELTIAVELNRSPDLAPLFRFMTTAQIRQLSYLSIRRSTIRRIFGLCVGTRVENGTLHGSIV